MGLRDLFGAAARHASGRIAAIDDRMLGERAMRQVRREHDEWARAVQAGVTYYTALPVLGLDHVRAGRIGRPVHGTATFDRRSSWGPLTGQWTVVGSTATSWGLWRQHGPLTTKVQWTHQDEDRWAAQQDAQMERGMGAGALDRFFSSPEHRQLVQRLERDYPATVAALAA
ncbi:hypothetical protein [Kitasatospora sp. NPDC127116]|uniref:hypothetical protein n=1 Tax=Kitasatospora sp. NPDC127116 TaxID=3345367 RepID=UPI0036281711